MDDEALVRAKTAYDHLVLTRQIDDEAYKLFVEKVDRTITKQFAVFAALGFGLTKTEWAEGSWGWLIGFLGITAAGSLALSLWIGLRALKIGHTNVVGVKNLHDKLLEEGQIAQLKSSDLTSQLAQNMADTILKNRSESDSRDKLMPWFNKLTLIGYGLSALFLAVTIIGSSQSQGDDKNDGQERQSTIESAAN